MPLQIMAAVSSTGPSFVWIFTRHLASSAPPGMPRTARISALDL
jgi:hypothetical protein